MASTSMSDTTHSEFVHIMPNHETELCNKLYRQWQESQLCDLVISLNGGQLRAHSCIFAAISPKMKDILQNSGQYKSNMNGIYIQLTFELEAEVFRCLLNMMYTGVLSFNTAILSSVLSAARWMQMHDVVRLCQEYKSDMGSIAEECVLTDDMVLCEVHTVQIKEEPADYFPNESLNPFIPQSHSKQPVSNTPVRAPSKRGRKRRNFQRTVTTLPKRCMRKRTKDKNQDLSDVIKMEPDPEGPEVDGMSSGASSSGQAHVDQIGLSATESTSADVVVEKPAVKRMRKARKGTSSEGKGAKGSLSKPKSTSSPDGDGSVDPFVKSHTQLVENKGISSHDTDFANFAMGKTDKIRCKRCAMKFRSMDKYLSHIQDHPAFTCDMCGKIYYRQSNMTRHKRLEHSAAHHLFCKICDFQGKTEKSLRTHFKEVHGDDKPFKCDYPGCTYSSWKYDFLNRHAEIHSDMKNYICNKCGQGFTQHAGLMSHHRTCYHLQQYLCDICGQAFNHMQSMRSHRRTIHFGEKPYLCRVCGNQFSDQRNLKRHMRIHENAFPYQCPVCQQNYRHSNSLKAHLKKHGDIGLNIKLTEIGRRKTSSRKGAAYREDVRNASVDRPDGADGSDAEGSDNGSKQLLGVGVNNNDRPAPNLVFPGQIGSSQASDPMLVPAQAPCVFPGKPDVGAPLDHVFSGKADSQRDNRRVLVEQIHPAASSTHSDLFTAVPLIISDPRLDPHPALSSSLAHISTKQSPEGNFHSVLRHDSDSRKPDQAMSGGTSPVTTGSPNQLKVDVLTSGCSGKSQTSPGVSQSARTAAETSRTEAGTGNKPKGQSSYGLQTLAEICFNSSA